ncbi:hypothetical protein, partial [Pseudomonas syringae group genomosp. 3]
LASPGSVSGLSFHLRRNLRRQCHRDKERFRSCAVTKSKACRTARSVEADLCVTVKAEAWATMGATPFGFLQNRQNLRLRCSGFLRSEIDEKLSTEIVGMSVGNFLKPLFYVACSVVVIL